MSKKKVHSPQHNNHLLYILFAFAFKSIDQSKIVLVRFVLLSSLIFSSQVSPDISIYSSCPVKSIASSGRGIRLNCLFVAKYATRAANATIKSPIVFTITAWFGRLEYSFPLKKKIAIRIFLKLKWKKKSVAFFFTILINFAINLWCYSRIRNTIRSKFMHKRLQMKNATKTNYSHFEDRLFH